MSLVRELLAGREERTVGDDGGTSSRTPPYHDVLRETSAVGVRFAAAPARGTLRLLAGMVRANRPWRLVLGVLSALTAVVATAAVANLNNTVRRVASALDSPRSI